MPESAATASARWPPIAKSRNAWTVVPNLVDYDRTRAGFSWARARAELDGLPGGRGLNIAHEAVDRHAAGPQRDRVALRWLSKDGRRRDFTFADLRDETNRFANVLSSLGVGKSDPVAVLAERVPELYIAALGTLKNGSVFTPLFSAFGPEPIQARIKIARAKVLVTTDALYRKKVEPLRASLPSLEQVLLIGDISSVQKASATRRLRSLMADADSRFSIPPTDPEDAALLHFTSGTTGTPKGAVHVHQAVVAHHATARFALDFHPDDVFWCTADPGWVTGTSYGIIAPLTHGITSVVDEADFDAERWYAILQSERVTSWYTAPTAIRMLMKVGTAAARQHAFPALRFLASVGEPLNPEAVVWGVEAFDRPFHDNWWQTETGGIMIANFAGMEIRPGSMGRPLPGIDAAIVRRAGEDAVEVIEAPDTEGELALHPGWPSMFRGYLSDEERYRKCFAGGYYLTGDLARRDRDGYYWFIGRADDVIKSSGHLIGPFEVESVLLEHPSIAEAGVIGKPDPTALEVVKAFVALKPGYKPSETLKRDLLGFARVRLGAAVAPMHVFDAQTRFYGGNAIVGGGLPVAVGLALADKIQQRPRITACFFGDGAVAEGEFHESLNLAALWKLPVLFLCENNLYAMGTRLDRAQSQVDLAAKARSYLMPTEPVDGMDVLAVEDATRRAAETVRRGEGPAFLECRTYRFRAHSMFDAELYREKSEVEAWKVRDPITIFTAQLEERGVATDAVVTELRTSVSEEIDRAVQFAEAGTWEPVEALLKDVYTAAGPKRSPSTGAA